ncbi:MAG: helix-turn-helix transcriptional regulator [Oceanicaulis sp.]|nr:helix-turn-helix transcriptional regulator [Oceanicaulis sp.]
MNWSVRELAERSKVHRNTVTNIETGRVSGDSSTLAAIRLAFEGAGVEFIPANGGGPGVRLAQP